MQYEMELTLVIRAKTDDDKPAPFEAQSVDKVVANNLTSLLGQFLLVLARIHKQMLANFKAEHDLNVMADDDIPF